MSEIEINCAAVSTDTLAVSQLYNNHLLVSVSEGNKVIMLELNKQSAIELGNFLLKEADNLAD